MITHLIFDLDNTLYSAVYGLEKNVSERIQKFLFDYMNIPCEESEDALSDLIRNKGYGSTIEWLMAEKGFTDIELYYSVINPENEVDSLPSDPGLKDFLASIPLPKAVLSNSALVHINRVLGKLGIMDEFDYIFDIHFNNYKGKPHESAFTKAIGTMKARPETTLFIDDYPEFVASFLRIGGNALLMDEFDRHVSLPYKRVKSLREIKNFLY